MPTEIVRAHGWTPDLLKEYVDQRMLDYEKAVNLALAASDKAVSKAEHAQELRNVVANEFRSSLSDLSNLMWTIKEGTASVESLRRELNAKIEDLKSRITLIEGRGQGYSSLWGWIVGAVGALIAAGAFIFKGGT